MELRHLRYFVAVADALNFRRAAEQLHVAQPALSKQIQDLEQELGARLLDRNTAGVRLTDAGAALLDSARELLAAAQQLPVVVREAAAGRRGRITIGNAGAMSAAFLPVSLTAFRQRYPEVEVNLREIRSAEQPAALATGQIQLGLMIGAQPPDNRKFDCLRVLRSPVRVYLAKDHALAARAALALTDLVVESFLAIAPARLAQEHVKMIRDVFVTRGLAEPSIKPVDGLESLIALIAGGHGISFLPRTVTAQRNIGLVTKPLTEEHDDLAFSLWAVWRRNDSSETVRNFVRLLRTSDAPSPSPARPRAVKSS
ncbi:MAG: LysR substrate-binding domain-containing protein [Opitutus sp.]